MPLGDRQAIVETAVDLQLGDRADADADADERDPQELTGQSRDRVLDAAAVVEPGLEQDAAGADGLGILGDQRTLLRGRGHREQRQESGERSAEPRKGECRSHRQKLRRLSTRIVTGPSLTSSTCIIA